MPDTLPRLRCEVLVCGSLRRGAAVSVVSALLAAELMLLGCAAERVEPLDLDAYRRSIAQWRADREARLKSPRGWLNLAGLYWLDEGVNSFGSAPDNAIVLTQGSAPAKLGAFLLEAGALTFRAEPGVDVFHNREPVTQLPLVYDTAGEPTLLTHGSLAWYAIRRMDRIGVRLRDYNHPALSAFPGIESYQADPSWRVEARFNAYPQPRKLLVTTVVEGLDWDPVAPGTLEFEIQGEPLSLEAYQSEDELFLVFTDRTAGETTYPGGRYLYADAPGPDGITVLDFNKAYNPPCVFNAFATCPLPTRRNYLPPAIEAGEKYSEALRVAGRSDGAPAPRRRPLD